MKLLSLLSLERFRVVSQLHSFSTPSWHIPIILTARKHDLIISTMGILLLSIISSVDGIVATSS